jgi:hypothetical protein
MKRKISIFIIAMYLQSIKIFKWLQISAKNFPELVTMPLTILALCIYPILLEISGINWLFNCFHDNPAEPNRSLKAFEIMLIAMIYVFLANAAAYAAIKYNRWDIWEQYTDREETTKIGVKELRFYWACYFFGILAAIFLAHSLILI